MPYTPFHADWRDSPDTTTPITAAALEHIEGGIEDAYAAAENALQETAFDAKGDLLVGTGSDASARTAVGADDEVLKASAAAAGGVVWSKIGNAMIAASADIALQKLAQEGATTGQAIAWNGTQWAPAAAGAVVLIEAKSLTAGATTIEFTSIPGTYRQLRLIGTVKSADAVISRELNCQVNGDTGNNYGRLQYYGHGAFAMGGLQAVTQPSWHLGLMPGTSHSWPTNFEIIIPNYAGTTFQKGHFTNMQGVEISSNGITRWNSAGYWTNTAAITSLKFLTNSGNFITGSTIALYGIS